MKNWDLWKLASVITQNSIVHPNLFQIALLIKQYTLLNASWIAISASHCVYHAEDGRLYDCKRIVMFKCLWRYCGEIVVWWYRTRKFLVFNNAKVTMDARLPEIEYKTLSILVPFTATHLCKSGLSSLYFPFTSTFSASTSPSLNLDSLFPL